MHKFAIVLAVLALPSVAYPCMNEVMLEGDDAVKAITQLEGNLEAGLYRRIESSLDGVVFVDRRLGQRAADVRMVMELRVMPKQSAKQAVTYFTARSKGEPRSMKFKAWLAESYAAIGKSEDAMVILTDLQKRDLMPDGFAYVTVAKLTSGADRDAALESCRKRAKFKSICVLPPPPVARRKTPPPRSEMRLPD